MRVEKNILIIFYLNEYINVLKQKQKRIRISIFYVYKLLWKVLYFKKIIINLSSMWYTCCENFWNN